MTFSENYTQVLKSSIALREQMLNDEALRAELDAITQTCIEALKKGGKILFCGNGGSAADAQHLAAELSGRFGYDRPPLASEALHVNSSFLTAVANDYSFAEAYARMVRAIGKAGDVLIALSTSGNSPNIINALAAAREMGLHTAGFSGATGGQMAEACDFIIRVPSTSTPRIQEIHITLGHLLCGKIEATIFPKNQA